MGTEVQPMWGGGDDDEDDGRCGPTEWWDPEAEQCQPPIELPPVDDPVPPSPPPEDPDPWPWPDPDPEDPGGGGGGDHGGGGTPPEPPPPAEECEVGEECEEIADFLLVIVEVEIDSTYVPVCPPELETRPRFRSQAYAWCNAQAPDSAQVQALNIALNRIEARGGFCKEIAQAGRNLIQAGEIRVFKEDVFPSGVDPTGGVGIQGRGIRLLANWFSYLNKSLGFRGWKVNLEFAVAHEIEHYLEGKGHVTPPGAPEYYDETPNARLCSGLL